MRKVVQRLFKSKRNEEAKRMGWAEEENLVCKGLKAKVAVRNKTLEIKGLGIKKSWKKEIEGNAC